MQVPVQQTALRGKRDVSDEALDAADTNNVFLRYTLQSQFLEAVNFVSFGYILIF